MQISSLQASSACGGDLRFAVQGGRDDTRQARRLPIELCYICDLPVMNVLIGEKHDVASLRAVTLCVVKRRIVEDSYDEIFRRNRMITN